MVDIFLEYGYIITGIVMALFASIVSFYSIKKYLKEVRKEQQEIIDKKINDGVDRVILHINNKTEGIQEKFISTDTKLTRNHDDIEDIKEDVKILEEDFKSLCQKIGKHEYIVDKVFPEYVNLKNSITDFKEKVNENLLSNKQHVIKNIDEEQEGFK